MTTLRPSVIEAKNRLAEGYERLKLRHVEGASGVEISRRLTDLRDEVVLDLALAALEDIGEAGDDGLLKHVALVAHGGYGRRDVAPFSDVDLMLLHPIGVGSRIPPFAERLLRDVFDAGLILGHSVRTPDQACRLAFSDAEICTALVESRLLVGDKHLYQGYMRSFQRTVARHQRFLIGEIDKSRLEERMRFGETVFLLEPNVKRSGGSLRDMQLIRWLGFVRYGSKNFSDLADFGALSQDDLEALTRASEFLLHLRNELHFHSGQPTDVLDRAEQLRIAEMRGYRDADGLLAVEAFMRDYFRQTQAVWHIAERFLARARMRDRWARVVTAFFGHRVEDGVHVGPAGMVIRKHKAEEAGRNLTTVIRLVDLANLYDKPIEPHTWEIIRREAANLPPAMPPPEACKHFLSLLNNPARIGQFLRDLHDAGLLERFIPAFARARGLLQFNQYHKFTVDEHCLRALEFATDLQQDEGPLGKVYRSMRNKSVLHLSLLLHDLGKGYLEDHREVGVQIAADVSKRLGLNARDAELLRFLVHKHMTMNHMAFRRDVDDQLAIDLAVLVGTPDVLKMLYVMTAADLGAVGPGVWDGWKAEIVTDLYHRAMHFLAGESPATVLDDNMRQRRESIQAWLGAEKDDEWFARRVEELPDDYLNATQPKQAASDLRLLHSLHCETASRALAVSEYLPETAVCQYTVATTENVAPGIFHKLNGALTSQGLRIQAAQIHTFADGSVLDRFWAIDPDFAGEPPFDRLGHVNDALVKSILYPTNQPPVFRRTWHSGGNRVVRTPGIPTRVNIDNSTSDKFTILDIFTHDRTGLLYAITRALFDLELSVARAKIGTYLDQVVDVFYVTDRESRKIEDETRLEEIRKRLLEIVETLPNS